MSTRNLALAFTVSALAGSAAFAQPADPQTSPPVTPEKAMADLHAAMVELSQVSGRGGNLRVGVDCADYFALADSGLHVAVDGAEIAPGELNGETYTSYTRHGNEVDSWVPTDQTYAAAPGHHHVAISAPGCATYETDVDVGGTPRFITGRLQISDTSLLGTAAAPNGYSGVLGPYATFRNALAGGRSRAGANDGYALDATTFTGVYWSTGYEHRHFVTAFDIAVGAGTTFGTVSGTPAASEMFQIGARLRFGYRVPYHDVSLAFGSGFGGELYIYNWKAPNDGITRVGPVDDDFIVPLWASVTYKPGCTWGFQVTASYDMQPANVGESVPTISGGLVLQPNDACSQPAGVTVR